MASFAVYDLARRAISHPNTASFVKRAVSTENGQGDNVELPVWGVVLLYASFAFGIMIFGLLSYMLQSVLITLCMVESPVAAITVSPSGHESGDKEEKEGLLEAGPTITLVDQKPITSSIRGTVKHIVAHAGRWARFRGIRAHALYTFAFAICAQGYSLLLPEFPGQPVLVAGLTGAVLSRLHATWAHKVISMPNNKSLWQSIVPKNALLFLALPAAVESAMPYVSIYIITGFGMLLRLDKLDQENMTEYKCAQWTSLALRLLAMVVFALVCTLFLTVPAIVTLIRMEASILPEDEDTIVPFDRTFGGKVVEKVMGGTGTIGFLDAWRSFNWEARRRLIKLFAKTFFILMGVWVVIAHILIFEIFAIMGPAVGKFLAQMKHDGLVSK